MKSNSTLYYYSIEIDFGGLIEIINIDIWESDRFRIMGELRFYGHNVTTLHQWDSGIFWYSGYITPDMVYYNRKDPIGERPKVTQL